ncbi:hypothetical protein ABZV31_12290 [Streptomyces sp. NPDC005202]|uniref:hypothetical protein n=1 Tax=Streptomyces sp. NPDC005202 TaxID=3157021 RepID=UPI0033AE88F0
MTDGQSRRPDEGTTGGNKAPAAALKDAGCSYYVSLPRRGNELGRRQGVDTNHDLVSVTRRLQGPRQPCGATTELIAAVLSERLGRAVLPADLGLPTGRQRPVGQPTSRPSDALHSKEDR